MPESPKDGPTPDLERLQNELVRLGKINRALMARVEREMDSQGSDFSLFQTAVVLEDQVRERTCKLESALTENEKITRALARAHEALEKEHLKQQELMRRLEETHQQLLQSEKMASIGQLAAGVAHEINNPIGFVSSNLGTLRAYVADLMRLVDLYEAHDSQLNAVSGDAAAAVSRLKQEIDLDFLREDIVKLIAESKDGADRVRRIVSDLRDYSRPGEEEWQVVDLHAGLESTLNVVCNEIKYKAEVRRDYGDVPHVECQASQLNQVFMNLLVNAAQSIASHGLITIRTGGKEGWVHVSIADTGQGIPPENLGRIFDPFFTTKPVGSGTGLGLSVSYGIVKKHGGRIEVESELGKGTVFTVWLPAKGNASASV